jgi:hypothetical protein
MPFLKYRWIWFFGLVSFAIYLLANRSGTIAETEKKLPETIDFNWHIRPILSDRCFACHGPDVNKRQGNLRLDTKEGAFSPVDTLNGQPRFAIVPGNTAASLLVSRIYAASPDSIMPPKDSHLSLTEFEKKLLTKWIEQGAEWKTHWAFTPAVRPTPPNLPGSFKIANPIDAFIGQKLLENNLEQAEETDPARLIRRASFVLTGLPPNQALTTQLEANPSAETYNSLIDTLLTSKAYGERWAMYWLELSRYSDTHGYQDDLPRIMWPWRDWVIKAFNENMPYDRFVTLQLAGDLLPDKNKETLLASAFNRNHKITQEGGVIEEEYRVEYVADRTNTFGKAFLGLTLECARCHDHKYDPISMRDFYNTFAFFNNVAEAGFVPNLQTPKPYMLITAKDFDGELSFLNKKMGLKSPKDTILQMVMRDSLKLRKTHRLNRGQYDQPAEVVTPSLPAVVLPFDSTKYEKNRIGMSKWLFDPANPLTARVMVNRLWQEVFGRGIVPSSENFGVQGALPTHPELLDWLAVEFQESGWNIRHLLKLMVTSQTFKQKSESSEIALARDPENTWLSRGPRYRMSYEFIRDNVLLSSGLLVNELGGPSVKPWQPPGLWEELSTEKSNNAYRGEYSYVPDTVPEKMYRRSLYTYQRRTIPPPSHLTFDAPTRDNCEVRRSKSNTPLQALVMLNDQQIQDAAQALAGSLLTQNAQMGADKRIEMAFQRIMTRKPTRKELGLLLDYFNEENKYLTGKPEAAEKITRHKALDTNPVETAALMMTITLMYNMDEALML